MYELAMLMPYVIAAVSLFVLIGAKTYRATAGIIFAVSIFNIGVSDIFDIVGERQWVEGPNNPYLYITVATIDALTAFFLMVLTRYAPNNTKMASWIALTLAASIFVNAIIIDQMINSRGFVYYNYVDIIFVINCGLVLLFIGGIYESGRVICRHIATYWRSVGHRFNWGIYSRLGCLSVNRENLEKRQ